MKKISILILCYNEEENIELMYEAVTKQMQKLSSEKYNYEIIFEDNDSEDNSQKILKCIAAKDKHVKVIFNQANFGPERSGVNCLQNATGDAYIMLACDFQEPPEMIPEFIKYWEEGYDLVWGQKTSSKESKIKYFLRGVYYKIIKLLSDYPQVEQVTGFGIMDSRVWKPLMISMKQDPDMSLRHLLMEYGFKMKLIPYTQQARERGKSSYNVWRYFAFAVTSLCNTSTKPLRLMTVFGIFASFMSLICGLVYFIYKITHWDSFSVGIAPLVIGLFFCASIQLLCIGILGEYVGVILRKVTDKPVVLEKEKINFEENTNE